MVAGMMIIPGMDALAKYLSGTFPVWQLGWARFCFHLLFMTPALLLHHGWKDLWPRRPFLQLTRGGFQMAATLLFFAALSRLPIADALAILFAYPLIVTTLSPLMLGERVGWKRWLAVIAGFGGILLILRPGWAVGSELAATSGVGWAGMLALGAALCFALYIVTTRQVSGTAPPLVTLAYSAVPGTVVLTVSAPLYWVWPAPGDWALMASMGLIAAFGHFLLVKAFELAPASLLAPFGYFEIVSATILGYLVFDDFPDPLAWVGIAIIVASGASLSMAKDPSSVGRPEPGSATTA